MQVGKQSALNDLLDQQNAILQAQNKTAEITAFMGYENGVQIGCRSVGVASFFTTERFTTAVAHIKTTLKPNRDNAMFFFEVSGYEYEGMKAIKNQYVGYCYYAGEALINVNTIGSHTDSEPMQYVSSDGYVVLRLPVSSSYFLTFSLDSVFCGAGKQFNRDDFTVTVNNGELL